MVYFIIALLALVIGIIVGLYIHDRIMISFWHDELYEDLILGIAEKCPIVKADKTFCHVYSIIKDKREDNDGK